MHTHTHSVLDVGSIIHETICTCFYVQTSVTIVYTYICIYIYTHTHRMLFAKREHAPGLPSRLERLRVRGRGGRASKSGLFFV